MKRHCKLIISTITMALIFTLILSPCSFALSRQQFGAWIASALTALNIVTSSTLVPYYNFVDDYLTDPFSIVEQSSSWDYIAYTWEDTDDFYDRSVLKIDKDVITVDGVDYTDIWLSTDAAEKFRTNAFDLKSAFNIASQSNGTFVSGIGTYDGIPLFRVNNYVRSQDIGMLASIGNTSWDYSESGSNFSYHWYNSLHNQIDGGLLSNSDKPVYFRIAGTSINNLYRYRKLNGYDYRQRGSIPDGNTLIDETPFDFDWVSSVIPPDEPLSEGEGLRIRVPTQSVDQWYQDYPDTGPNVTINMGDPELTQKVDDLIDLIIPLIPVLDIDFVDYVNPEPQPEPEPIPEPDPYPDPDPQPGTVIPDLDWTDLFQTIKNIFNKISEHVSISTAIKNILDKIKWFLDDFFGDLGDILNNLPDIFERHVIDTIRRGLTGLKNIFLPILALLRNALGIWHYVVEWFQAISAPFTFYLSVLGQGYPLITIPIYASIAGVIVIAVYRRFGR